MALDEALAGRALSRVRDRFFGLRDDDAAGEEGAARDAASDSNGSDERSTLNSVSSGDSSQPESKRRRVRGQTSLTYQNTPSMNPLSHAEGIAVDNNCVYFTANGYQVMRVAGF